MRLPPRSAALPTQPATIHLVALCIPLILFFLVGTLLWRAEPSHLTEEEPAFQHTGFALDALFSISASDTLRQDNWITYELGHEFNFSTLLKRTGLQTHEREQLLQSLEDYGLQTPPGTLLALQRDHGQLLAFQLHAHEQLYSFTRSESGFHSDDLPKVIRVPRPTASPLPVPMHRASYLLAPLDYRHVSSPFSPSRLHPILGTRRPHLGVDLAAPSGTPVRASADGRIIHQGWKGGYGKTIIIAHGREKQTLYAHLSSYAPHLREGMQVRQGDMIGRVGMTGLATAPHLHYELRIRGRHQDPLPFIRHQQMAHHTLRE